MIYEFRKDSLFISTDKRKLNIGAIHAFLSQAYWSEGVAIERVRKSISNSLCFGVYLKGEQAGFARVVTDYTNIGYLADVFVIEKFRGMGISKLLMKSIVNHPDLKNLKAWLLATRDAHGLYKKFGFEQLKEPERYMKRMKNPKHL